MPLGRSRTSKRTSSSSSSSSYTSTITTIAFIAVCVIGVWMVTSNAVVPTPQTPTRTGKVTPVSAIVVVEDNDVSSSRENQNNESSSNKKEDQPVYEDNPGDLPADAIKSDDDPKTSSDQPSSNGKQESGGEENSQDLKGKRSSEDQEKQRERKTKVSEESTLTQRQQVDQNSQENSEAEQGSSNGNQEQSNITTETGEKSQQEQEQQQENVEKSTKTSQEPLNQESHIQESQQQEESQNTKSYEEQQQQQLQEDAGIQIVTSRGSQNDASEEDQQQQQQQQQQQKPKEKQQKQYGDKKSEKAIEKTKTQQHTTVEDKSPTETNSAEASILGGGASAGIPKESKESKNSWSTQATESENQKERRKEELGKDNIYGYIWQLCNVTTGADYIPCLDNDKQLKKLRSTRHFEHRERHCPEEGPTCLVPIPEGYKKSIPWPASRDKAVPNIEWGKHTRVVLDVGCGVASFGGYLFDKDVLTMSFAPKDEHEAQVQFALERGIPAISAVMGSQRLPFPSRVFDLLHCARCRVPWHADDGMLLLELNRILRPGGYFVWSATPVYQKLPEDVAIWQAMSALTRSMCWERITIKKDKLNSIAAAIYRKPTTNDCYNQRKKNNPPMCKSDDDPNAAWYVPLQACMHQVPVDSSERGTRWPENWPKRVHAPPYWLNSSQMGIYGKPAPQDFATDYEHWKHVVRKSYMKGLGISWSNVRNIMDMRAVYGGFAAALMDLKVWVLNVVNIDSPDTLPIIYERGLFGIYHDWCESFSTYPRSYDLLHADHLFSKLKKRCKLASVMAEVDRIVRPGGKLIVRDESSAIGEVENLLKSLKWEVYLTYSKDQEGLLSAQKGEWRPQIYAASSL
ncbi:hypothetical protein JCGZ_13663 [Jatropha curcas]|uniref:Methyltransferase n=1 Tax=Jatropha curcas TaxID=180498 RepID=A0A067KK83_JATCU|nr:hypothetical protein JCGZ_13663 [Jatropha curcas]